MSIRGHFKFDVVGDVIYVTFNGMFNAATSKKVADAIEHHVHGLNDESFYLLLDLSNYEGSTPDAHKLANEHAIWLEGQNCLGKAIVVTDRVVLDIARNQQKFLSQSIIRSQVFNSKTDAETWLAELAGKTGLSN